MKAAILVATLACFICCAQARQMKQYLVYIPQQGGQQVQVTAAPAAPTGLLTQLPQLTQQGSQAQYTAATAQQVIPISSQATQPEVSSYQRGQQSRSGQPSTTRTTPAPSGDTINDPVLQEVLDLHNDFRARHQVGALSWSSALQGSAQDWANRCVFQHSGPGENLAQYFPNFAAAFKGWVDEEANYAWDGQFSYATGHFTEIVWKDVTQIGCGYAPSCSLYVCHYDPPGNVIGQFNENVFRPVS